MDDVAGGMGDIAVEMSELALSGGVGLADSFGEMVNVPMLLPTIAYLRGVLPARYDADMLGSCSFDDVNEVIASLGGACVRREAGVRDGVWSALFELDECYVSSTSSESSAVSYVFARDMAKAKLVGARLSELGRVVEEDEGNVRMMFVYSEGDGMSKRHRPISAPAWDDIAFNYSADARSGLERLMGMEMPENSGKLVLMHGPPGTGKTTAIRALSRAWRAWCDVVYVMDPEALFSNPGYLQELVLDGVPMPGSTDRWRLYVIEDADEIIGVDAKAKTGQALSKLLNITDGIVGQGLKSLFLITTNEPVGAMHPAVTRPGRCLAELEVGKLTRAEAGEWLAREGSVRGVRGEMSLAELYALERDEEVEPKSDTRVGQYL